MLVGVLRTCMLNTCKGENVQYVKLYPEEGTCKIKLIQGEEHLLKCGKSFSIAVCDINMVLVTLLQLAPVFPTAPVLKLDSNYLGPCLVFQGLYTA